MTADKSHVYLHLLGGLEARFSNSAAVSLPSKKSQALLAFLAQHAVKPQSREKLSSLLWGEAGNQVARANLRQCVALLRKALDHNSQPCVLNSGVSVHLDFDLIIVDTHQFEQLCNLGTVESLQQAISLYSGEFMEGFALDEILFEDWLYKERRRLQEIYLHALQRLLEHCKSSGDNDNLIKTATKLLHIDAFQESVHRDLMTAYQAQGRRGAAQQQYELFRDNLIAELGLEPERQTKQLYRQILSQQPGASSDATIDLAEKPQLAESSLYQQPAPADVVPSVVAVVAVVEMPPSKETSKSSNIVSPVRLAAFLIGLALTVLITVTGVRHFTATVATSEVQSKVVDPNTGSSLLPMLDKPSIAVVPFVNLSDDPSQVYFSDGLSADLITDLSQVSGLHVIARSTSFVFRDQSLSKSYIAEQLGVRFLLDGSIRKVGDRVRINANLIDTETGMNIWADRYDRQLTDILLLQDEVTKTIVRALSITLTDKEQHRLSRSQKIDPDAYDLLLRGLVPFRTFTGTGNIVAREYFRRAIAADPGYARAYGNLAVTYGREVVFRYNDGSLQEAIELGLQAAARAQGLDSTIPQVQFARSVLLLANLDHIAAVQAARLSLSLDPQYADGYAVLAITLLYSGQLGEALNAIQRAKQLYPQFPFSYLYVQGHIQYLQGNYQQALLLLIDMVERNPSFYAGQLLLAATYAQLDLSAEAQWQAAEILTLNPDFSLTTESQASVYLNTHLRDHLLDGLRKAGLPE